MDAEVPSRPAFFPRPISAPPRRAAAARREGWYDSGMGWKLSGRTSPRHAVFLLTPVVLAVVLVWFTWPGTGVTHARIAKLHPGMTQDEVQAILGVPDDTTMYSGKIDQTLVSQETWVYRVGEKRLTLHFSGRKLSALEDGGI